MLSDVVMDFIKDECEQKIYSHDKFMPSSSPGGYRDETTR
jgi:hypothetical protein